MQTVMVQGRVYNYSHCVGNNAVSGAGFHYPNGLARGNGQIVYVLNQPDELQPVPHVSVVDIGNGWHEEEHIRDFGENGSEDGNFIWPAGIALDSEGHVYVADEWLNSISVFDSNGRFLDKWGVPGSMEGQLGGPTGLAFDSQDNLLVTEYQNHRVQKFTKDGKFIMTWGKKGSESGEFKQPWGITVDKDDNVYVADWHNDRVEKFSSNGSYLRSFGKSGTGKGELHFPSSVAVDSDGDVYVTDWWNHKLEVFDDNGTPLTTFFGDAERLSKWAQERVDSNPDAIKARLRVKSLEPDWRFNRPTAVATGDDGKILVAESQRMRIQIYQKEKDWVDPQFNL